MHAQTLEGYRHDHLFLGDDHARNERKTRIVIAVCGAMMAAEIGGGALFGSMALIADGIHMSTHAGALLIAALAYGYARRHARDARFAFGTGKFGDLAGYTSAIALAMIALLIGYESVERLLHPVRIAFNEAIPVACLGLGVNCLSAWLLKDDHDHHDGHAHDDHMHDDHGHDDHDRHRAQDRDLNLRAAYIHVLADAVVSVCAIIGLVAGRELGWIWMDPVMGIAGALVISLWSWGLVRAAGAVLLDMRPSQDLAAAIGARLETAGDRVADLHLWQVGPGHNAAIVSLVTHTPQAPSVYKGRLSGLPGLSHVTVEVATCEGAQEPA